MAVVFYFVSMLQYFIIKGAGMKRILSAALAVFMLAALCGCDDIKNIPLLSSPDATVVLTDPPKDIEKNSEPAGLYGYNNLQSDLEREVYRSIDEHANRTLSEPFYVSGENQSKLVSDVFEVYDTDHPEVFWVGGDYDFEYYNSAGNTVITLAFSMSGYQLEDAIEKFNSTTDEILENAPLEGSDFEKELFINDYIIANCDYNDEAAYSSKVIGNEHNAYGALVEGLAVCEGYAKAFQYLCNKLGVECVSINGICEDTSVNFSGNHIWNCVKLDGEWYHVDVTWNDYDVDDRISEEVVRHSYLNLTAEEILKNHAINPYYYSEEAKDDGRSYNSYIPYCDAVKYNYFNYYYPTLESVNKDDDVKKRLAKAASKHKDSFIINVADRLDFDGTYRTVLESKAYDWLSYSNKVNDSDHQVEETCYIYTYGGTNIMVFALTYK